MSTATSFLLRARSFLVTGACVSLVACSSSDPTPGGSNADAGTTADAVAPTVDASAPAAVDGLVLSNATVPAIDGTYAIEVFRTTTPNGLAFNGNFDGRIEIEVDTDTTGAVKAAHVWSYVNQSPDKFYGCDGKATTCATVTADVQTNVITIAKVTWPEVVQPTSFDGTQADTLVPSGAKVDVAARITAKAQ